MRGALAKTNRIFVRTWRFVRTKIRHAVLRTRYPTLRIGRGAKIREGVEIAITDNGSCSIGRDVVIKRGTTIVVKYGRLTIGHGVEIGEWNVIVARGRVHIGKGTLTAERVTIRDQNHVTASRSVPIKEQGLECKPVRVGADVWVGANVVVVAGTRIGRGSVIGAGSVVTRDIPRYSVAMGVPARVHRSR